MNSRSYGYEKKESNYLKSKDISISKLLKGVWHYEPDLEVYIDLYNITSLDSNIPISLNILE